MDTGDVKKLREETGLSIMLCKKALELSGGDFNKAFAFLKKESAGVAEKKKERATGSGIIASYVHGEGRIGVLAEVRCETDFVARNDAFKEFAHNIAMHIAALNPHFLSPADASEELQAEMLGVFKSETESLNKPADIKEKIISGKMDAFLKERSLLTQPYIKNQDITVEDYIKETVQKFGENITIARFVRFSL
ncbi:MAG: elongation factor Ts [Patescibacteria group bacterium]